MPTNPTHDPNTQPIGENPFIFTNEEGDTFYWDFNKKHWFIPQEQLEEDDQDIPVPPLAVLGKRKREEELVNKEAKDQKTEGTADASKPPEKKKKNKKKKKPNSSIFISNLPKNATVEEVYEFSKTAGIVRRDPYTGEYFIRLYPDSDGSFSGDALVTFFKSDSIPLALEILDGKYFRNAPAKVTVVCFSFHSSFPFFPLFSLSLYSLSCFFFSFGGFFPFVLILPFAIALTLSRFLYSLLAFYGFYEKLTEGGVK